ncbi:hypothetical protein Bca4012_031991 [Brassica carinata]|nr:PREDICTED: chromatin modification-related protein MEAF6 isoform X2 [Brassica oleracea var. oleracea]XP_013686730.1 chromatin modification-related protein MEAF6 isoform X4 [Brassica napus]CAF1856162.1 unnamed protein product [Brassica napus]
MINSIELNKEKQIYYREIEPKMSLGQKGSGDPGAMLTSLLNKREKLRQDLRSIEKQVYELETSYLQESSHIGNALKGFEGFLSSSKSTASAKRSRKFQPEDRVFSLSSVTSPAAEELGVGREDGRAELGPGRSKGGLSTGQGKPKKGRGHGVARDAKRNRPSEPDYDDEDDPDASMYVPGSLI